MTGGDFMCALLSGFSRLWGLLLRRWYHDTMNKPLPTSVCERETSHCCLKQLRAFVNRGNLPYASGGTVTLPLS